MKKLLLTLATIFTTYYASAQVGAGTTTPSNDLDVESNSGSATAVDINNTSTGDPKINLQLNGTTTFSMGIDNSDSDKFKIGTSALETNTRFTIDASGNIGIANSSPTQILQVGNAGRLRISNGTTDYSLLGTIDNNGGTNTRIVVSGNTRGGLPGLIEYVATSSGAHVWYTTDAGTERMRLTSAGYLGIGNTAPTALLDVDGSAIFNESGAIKNFRVESDNNANMLYVDGTNDRVGIACTPSAGNFGENAALHVNGNIKLTNGYQIYAADGNNGITLMEGGINKTGYRQYGGNFNSSTIGSNGHVFMCNGSNVQMQLCTDFIYMPIKLGIGTTNTSYMLAVGGQPAANGYTAFTNYSDSRLKTNISSLDTGALSKIMQLRPVSFQYNQKYLQLYSGSDLNKVHKGFIAQEIRQVFPEMVSEMAASPDSVQYLDLDVSHLQVYLVKALQEQQAIIESQKAKNEAQEREIDALKLNALKVADLENKMNAMLLLLNNKQELTVKQ